MFKRNISTKNLGVPLRVAKLKRKDWSGIIEKIQKKKKLQGWQSQFTSLEGRIVLINSVLFTISLY